MCIEARYKINFDLKDAKTKKKNKERKNKKLDSCHTLFEEKYR